MGDTSIAMKLSRDLTCAEVVELVTEYLEGGLSPHDRERFEEHLGVCDLCATLPRADAADDRRAPVGCGEEDLDPALQDALIDVFRGWKTE